MKKIYFTFLLLLCTASVFSSQMYQQEQVKKYKIAAPAKADSSTIISGMIALPSFR